MKAVKEVTHKRAAKRWPFRDQALMTGLPSCTIGDPHMLRLRKCPFDLNTITWTSRLGGELDGYCWKVKFGDEGPFVLKLFWDRVFSSYFAVQRECKNAALLQMVETAVEDRRTENNTLFFSAQAQSLARRSAPRPGPPHQGSSQTESGTRPIQSVPRLRKCYGWLSLARFVNVYLFHFLYRIQRSSPADAVPGRCRP